VTRFLLDENVPLASVHRLRRASHDVVQVPPRETDRVALERGRAEERVVVTFDRDFGFLILRADAAIPRGVVYFRSPPANPEAPAAGLLALLATPGITLEGKFTVVELARVRQRPLPHR
jgi:predicted nuclease of predicted toxin-antitoxin system